MRRRARADRRVLRWFGHVERMDEYRMARRILMTEVSLGLVRGRPRLGFMDGVKVILGNRGMTVEAAPFGPPSRALVVITWRGVGCRYMMRLG